MDFFFSTLTAILTPQAMVFVLAVAVLAGLVKGIVGFAMPMILISGLSSLMAPDVALAALILPTLVTNIYQALMNGGRAAWQAVTKFRLFLGIGAVMLVISAQLVAILPQDALYLMIGVPVTAFALMQLTGWQPNLRGRSTRSDLLIGGFAGFIGGLSGVWGPPTVAYLTAINTPKAEQMRVQGVIYGLGAVVLAAAHLQSGVLRADTAPLSALLILPAFIGMYIGVRIQARIDQARFKQVTLLVLLVAGLNLIRRGVL